MSRKSNRKDRKVRWKPGYYKLIDDKSGFYMYSDEIKVDWRGRVTRANNWDPKHPSEMPVTFRPERKLPFTRDETPDDQFISVPPMIT